MSNSTTSRTHSSRYVIFRLSDKPYALTLDLVREVIAIRAVTRIPNSPAYFEGIVDIRGLVLPVFDIKQKFGFDKVTTTPESAIILLGTTNSSLGIIVDSIHSVLTIPEDKISHPLSLENVSYPHYISGVARIDNELIPIVNLDAALDLGLHEMAHTQHKLSA